MPIIIKITIKNSNLIPITDPLLNNFTIITIILVISHKIT
jgi:hypothetical protein